MAKSPRRYLAVLLLLVLFILLGTGWFVMPRRPLPDVSEIDQVRATVFLPEQRVPIKFEIPKDFLPRIWAAVQPAKRDPVPAKWVVLGDLTVTSKDGRQLQIFLFKTGHRPGAFAVGPTWEDRDYYRGGDSAALEKALEEAYEASKQPH